LTSASGRARVPLVSVAIPAYNAERWLGDALESALGQTLDDLEVVVVDDASSDGTAAVAAGFADPRIRRYANERNAGHSANWDRAISLCRAPYVKLLSADDYLREDCLERMLRPFLASETVGMVFSRREIVFAPSDREAAAWRDAYEAMFRRFGPLAEVNSGRRLFEVYLAAGFDDNWIGEPSNVMVRRAVFERLAGFHPHIRQAADMELWIRLLFHADVGFVDEALVTYRLLSDSVTQQTRHGGRRWLDRLWLLEALREDPEIRAAYPDLRRLVWRERAKACLALAGHVARPAHLADRLREARAYVAYLAANRSRSPLLEQQACAPSEGVGVRAD
jgi:glycosyltransferase involved in cell wall biosynthesis